MYKATILDRTLLVEGKDNNIIDGKAVPMDILEYRKGKFHVLIENRSYTAHILSVDRENKTCELMIGNKKISVQLRDQYDELLKEMGIQGGGKKVNDIKAPMPGLVLQVMVENGQSIRKGDALLVLEAMKMENILKSPADGVIRKIQVAKGDKVEKNQVMISLE